MIYVDYVDIFTWLGGFLLNVGNIGGCSKDIILSVLLLRFTIMRFISYGY